MFGSVHCFFSLSPLKNLVLVCPFYWITSRADQVAVGSNEPVKRRRWNSENLKVPELQSPLQTPSVTPKDTFQTPSLKRSFSRSNSTMSEDAPKERVGELLFFSCI